MEHQNPSITTFTIYLGLSFPQKKIAQDQMQQICDRSIFYELFIPTKKPVLIQKAIISAVCLLMLLIIFSGTIPSKDSFASLLNRDSLLLFVLIYIAGTALIKNVILLDLLRKHNRVAIVVPCIKGITLKPHPFFIGRFYKPILGALLPKRVFAWSE